MGVVIAFDSMPTVIEIDTLLPSNDFDSIDSAIPTLAYQLMIQTESFLIWFSFQMLKNDCRSDPVQIHPKEEKKIQRAKRQLKSSSLHMD